MPQLDEEQQLRVFRQFTRWFAIAICLLISLPTLYGVVIRPAHSLYFGLQYNIDDHMVYGAWMRQAMEGRFLFENRFATEPQPGLTLHLYFLVLGWVAKLTGIPIAMYLARVAFTFLSITLLGRLTEQVTNSVFSRKIALSMSVLGGGMGFMVWHTFGVAFSKPGPEFLQAALLSRLPTDVWQPEGFFLPSALTNGLFMVSLALMLGVMLAVLKAKESPKSLLPGAICFGVLMNIHSYDVLLVALVFVGLVAVSIANKQLEKKWFLRVVGISLGVVPFALWFVYVLKNDPVFQARAETLTFSPNFRQLAFGYFLLIAGALVALIDKTNKRALLGIALFVALVGTLWQISSSHLEDGYFMNPIAWVATFAVVIACLVLIKPNHPALALVVCWAMVGLIAPYFPALFQRKLTMMLSIPWGLLAGLGIARLIENRERGQRNLLATLVLLLGSATGLQWIMREVSLARKNVSNTTVHSVYQIPDFDRIADVLRPIGRDVVVMALPGVPSPVLNEDGTKVEDSYDTPIMPDINPMLVAMAGVKAYAGHWSETPAYSEKRAQIRWLLDGGDAKELGITHLVLPKEGLPNAKTPADYGEVLFEGTQLSLIKVR